jgi:hypothetical protein
MRGRQPRHVQKTLFSLIDVGRSLLPKTTRVRVLPLTSRPRPIGDATATPSPGPPWVLPSCLASHDHDGRWYPRLSTWRLRDSGGNDAVILPPVHGSQVLADDDGAMSAKFLAVSDHEGRPSKDGLLRDEPLLASAPSTATSKRKKAAAAAGAVVFSLAIYCPGPCPSFRSQLRYNARTNGCFWHAVS